MPGLLAIFGLLAAVFAGAGGSGASASTTTVSAENDPTPSEGEPVGEPADTGGDMTDDMSGDMAGHDHGDGMDHGGHGSGMDQTFTDITAFGVHHGTSSHTHHDSLEGGRTPITTEAMDAYNGLRAFLGLDPVDLETVGQWAFDNRLTNNDVPYGDDLPGVGLFYGMQGAKVGWIRDDAFDPQILADIQRTARTGEVEDVMAMVEQFGLDGYANFLESEDLVDTFVNTLKMEPHYGGWMHGRTHGWRPFEDESGEPVAIAHDLNHLTVLSHDQTQPFMNDTFDWPQWPALDMPEADVANYFQSMVTLGNPEGPGIETASLTESFVDGDMLMLVLSTGPLEEETADVPEVEDELLELL